MRHIGVMIRNFSALSVQQVDNFKGGRLPQIIYVGFVSHAKHQHSRAIQRFAVVVQRLHHLAQHIGRHTEVDFFG